MQLYDIRMHTPLGDRCGQMRVQVQDGRIWGEVSLLGRTQAIDGTVSADGHVEFQGTLVTLLNIIDYRATGMMNGNALLLSLEGQGQTFAVTGTLRREAK